ncbi:MAG: hypothetical protein AAGD86_05870, partial [Pseudomonadota bacterium]
ELAAARADADARVAKVSKASAEELGAMSAVAAERQADIQRLSEDVQVWREKFEAAQADAARAAEQPDPRDEEIRALRDDVATLQTQRDALRGEFDAALATAAEEAAELRANIARLSSDAGGQPDQAAGQAGGDSEALRHEVEQLQAQLTEARTAMATLRDSAADAEAAMNKNTLRLKQTEARLTEASAEREAQVKTIQSLRNRNRELEDDARQFQAQLAAEPVDAAGADVPELVDGDEDPATRLAQLEPLFRELTNANRLLVTKQVAMQATISNHSGELKKRAVLIDRLKKKLIAVSRTKPGTGSSISGAGQGVGQGVGHGVSKSNGASETSQKELLEYRNRVRDLEAKLTDHGARYRSLEQARDQWQQHAAVLKRAMEERDRDDASTAAADGGVQRLEAELAGRDRRLADLEAKLSERDEALDTVRAQAKSWMTRVAPLVAALKEKDDAIAKLEAATPGDVGGEGAPGTDRAEATAAATAALEASLAAQTERADELEARAAALAAGHEQAARERDEELAQLRAELKERGDVITELENDTRQLAEYRDAVDERDAQIAALEARLAAEGSVAAHGAGAAERMAQLEAVIAELLDEASESEQRIGDLETLLRDRQSDFGASGDEQVALGEVSVLRTELAAQSVLIDNLEADLKYWKRRAKAIEGNEA